MTPNLFFLFFFLFRYKAKGDPSGFKAFLKAREKSCGVFVRYVGNRLHVFFHLAGTVVLYKGLLEEYLESHCAAQALGAAILKDLRDDHIMSQLVAAAWLGKLITGPWMALMYSPMHERQHLEMVSFSLLGPGHNFLWSLKFPGIF